MLAGWWFGKHELPNACFPETIQGLGNYPRGGDVAWAQLDCGSAPGQGRAALGWVGSSAGLPQEGAPLSWRILCEVTSRLCLELSPGCPWTPSGSWLSPGAMAKRQQESDCTFPSRTPWLAQHSWTSPVAFLLYLRAHISQQQIILLWQAAGQPPSHLRYLGLKSFPALFGWCVLLSTLRSRIKHITEGLAGWFLPKAGLVQSWLLLKCMLGRHALLWDRKETNSFIIAQTCPPSCQHQSG